MDAHEIVVALSGIVLSALILWYFFGPRQGVSAQIADGGIQEVKVVVKGGYSPDVIVVKQGAPVKLDFYRDETASCSEEIVFGDFGIARHLPPFQTTTIEFTPETAGEFTFTCGMNMMRGKLVVEQAAVGAV